MKQNLNFTHFSFVKSFSYSFISKFLEKNTCLACATKIIAQNYCLKRGKKSEACSFGMYKFL